MTRGDVITWAGRVTDTQVARGTHVYLGYTALDILTPRSPTAVGQRRDTIVATRKTAATGRGVTGTTRITGCTAELIPVVRMPTHSTDTITHSAHITYTQYTNINMVMNKYTITVIKITQYSK